MVHAKNETKTVSTITDVNSAFFERRILSRLPQEVSSSELSLLDVVLFL
jgi:hypothetical protein